MAVCRAALPMNCRTTRLRRRLKWVGQISTTPLLDVMAGRFDVLVTVDKNLPKQQRIDNRPLAVVVLRAKTNRLADLLPHVPRLRAVLENARPGQVYEISG
jgi:hypothetical protein